MSDLPAKVDIREVSLRDGLQIEQPIPLSAKLELLEAVVATGVREVEATAFVSPSKVPALADAAELAAELGRFDQVEFSALVASPNGAKRAIAAGLRSIEYVVSAADSHSRANVGRSSMESVAAIPDIVAIAHDSGATVEVIIATAWDCPFDGPTPPQRVLEIVDSAVDFGVDRLAIADTIGTATPAGSATSSRRCVPASATCRWAPISTTPAVRAGQRVRRGPGRDHPARRLGRRAGRLPLRTGCERQHRHRGLGLPVARQRIDCDVDLQGAIAAAEVARTVVGHDLPSALLRAGDRIIG